MFGYLDLVGGLQRLQQAPAPWQGHCPGCPPWMMGGGGWGWMALSMIVWTLVGIALLVLIVVAIVRLWPRGGPTFRASEPPGGGRRADQEPARPEEGEVRE